MNKNAKPVARLLRDAPASSGDVSPAILSAIAAVKAALAARADALARERAVRSHHDQAIADSAATEKPLDDARDALWAAIQNETVKA